MSNHVYLSLAFLDLNSCVNVKYRILLYEELSADLVIVISLSITWCDSRAWRPSSVIVIIFYRFTFPCFTVTDFSNHLSIYRYHISVLTVTV